MFKGLSSRVATRPSARLSQVRHASIWRETNQPLFKSIFLTLLFGSVTIDLMRNRKNYEALESSYGSKIMILEDIAGRLERGERVDITKELRLANSLTQNRYDSVTDIEFDEHLERLVKGLDESPAAAAAASSAPAPRPAMPDAAAVAAEAAPAAAAAAPYASRQTSKYL
ncbi:hypothetical protein ABC855_g2413 [[Candida] zeylanoides]